MRGRGSCNRGGFVPGTNVIVVTNRNATGSGSFDAAMGASCPKVILFGVAGAITRDGAVVPNRCDNWSVIGSSAPGEVALLEAGGSAALFNMKGSIDNWTIGHMLMAGGDKNGGPGSTDTFNMVGQRGPSSNGIIYNMTLLWGNDGVLDCNPSGNSPWSNITMWQNIIGVPLKGAAGVSLMHITCNFMSSIRNFYTHSAGRNPQSTGDGNYHSNNFIANPGYGAMTINLCGSGNPPASTRIASVNMFMVRGNNSSDREIVSTLGQSTSCGRLTVYETGNAQMNQSQQISNCNNHNCTSGFSGNELTSNPIAAIEPPGYVPETLVKTQQGLLDFATLITDHAGSHPLTRISYVDTLRDQAINMVDGSGPIGGWRPPEYPSGGSNATTSSSLEGGISVLYPATASYDPTNGADNPCGENMPTGAAAAAITTSGLTRLHEWAIGCFMDNVMPPGYREDTLQYYAVPGGNGSGDIRPNPPLQLSSN